MARRTGSAGNKLATYRAKRDFERTTEPAGQRATSDRERFRFVIQKHAARRLHYDLRLELDGVFRSWAVTRGPSLDPADKRLAVEVEDHPLEYGDFEGTIPKGEYGGGTVLLWDRGYWQPANGEDPASSLAQGELKFELDGERLHGGWVLVRMKRDRTGGKRNNWLLIKHRDDHAKPGRGDSALAAERSVASGRSMNAIAQGKGASPKPFMTKARPRKAAATRGGPMPAFIEPQLCKAVDRAPNDEGWGHEIKFDGYRMQLRVESGSAVLRTRKGLDWTERFARIAEASSNLPDGIYDGEIVALDRKGAPDFAGLQAALSSGNTAKLVYFLFDLLYEGPNDLRAHPLRERKQQLQKILARGRPRTAVRYVEHFETGGQAVLESACRMQLEGIISKRLGDPYRSGRSGSWTKAKCRAGNEVVIGGWSAENRRLRSLLVGVHRDGQLVHVGRVGTGFGGSTAADLARRLAKLETDRSPFAGPNAPPEKAGVHWVKPTLVAEIEFAGWTGSGMVRQGAFKGLREDKPAREIGEEKVVSVKSVEKRTGTTAPAARGRAGATDPVVVLGVPISHPEKIMWPAASGHRALTKADLARYYGEIAPLLLPHIAGRPCSVVRAPDGIAGQRFFQRHAMQGTSNLLTLVTVSGDRKPYLQVDRVEAIAALAQSGAIELHPWNCVPGMPEEPGRFVFDLDPGPDVDFRAVITAAGEIRERVEALGLVAWCKTTGGKGLHVVVPLAKSRRKVGWPAGKEFAAEICRRMAADDPSRYVATMAKKLRVGKIFLDYLRNDRTATAVAPYSARVREAATVSMPVAWTKLRAGFDPARFTIETVPRLARRNADWDGYDESARPLDAAIKRLAR